MINQYSVFTWRGQEQVTCREAATDSLLMHHESDVPNFSQISSKDAYLIVVSLTLRFLNDQLIGRERRQR
jgi:hypothetical protein